MDVFVDSIRYHVNRSIKGGMGKVWLVSRADAEDDEIYQPTLAVKTFDEIKSDINVENELNNWIALEHPNVLNLLKIGRLNFQTAALMPQRNESLNDYLIRAEMLDIDVTRKILAQTVSALEYAYDIHKLTHLDIKPQNVLIRSYDPVCVEVSDWGISRPATVKQYGWFGVNSSKSTTKFGVGTLPFMAPERFSGKWIINHKVDIYSVGMMAVQLLTGQLPFESTDSIANDIITGNFLFNIRGLLQNYPKPIELLCMACVDPNPRNRPRTYREVLSMISEI